MRKCARSLEIEWWLATDDLPTEWFAELTASPRQLAAPALPFSEEDKQYLQECPDCCEEVYKALQHRAELRWRMLCSTVEEMEEWLEAEEGDLRLEAHVRGCGLCQEVLKRQAWLWEGAGLLPASQVDVKLAVVGLTE